MPAAWPSWCSRRPRRPSDEPRRSGGGGGDRSAAGAVRVVEGLAPAPRAGVPARALRLPRGAAPVAERRRSQRRPHRPALRAPLRLVPLRRRAPDHAEDLRVGDRVRLARRLSGRVSPGHERCAVAEPADLLGAPAVLDELSRPRVRLDGAPRTQRRAQQAAGGDRAHERAGRRDLQLDRGAHRHDARPHAAGDPDDGGGDGAHRRQSPEGRRHARGPGRADLLADLLSPLAPRGGGRGAPRLHQRRGLLHHPGPARRPARDDDHADHHRAGAGPDELGVRGGDLRPPAGHRARRLLPVRPRPRHVDARQRNAGARPARRRPRESGRAALRVGGRPADRDPRMALRSRGRGDRAPGPGAPRSARPAVGAGRARDRLPPDPGLSRLARVLHGAGLVPTGGFIDWPPQGFSLKWYRAYLESPQWMAATVRSVGVGVVSATLAMLIGVPAAFALARREFTGKTGALALILSPLVIPRMIIAVALFYLYARIGLVGTSLGLVLGHAVLAIPFVVVTVMAVLKNYDERLDQAASSLGANRARTLYHVRLPLIRGGLVAAFLFAFVTSFDELTIALFVTGGLTTTLPKQMWDDALLKVSPTLAAVSTVLIVFVAVTIWLAERLRQG